jgi:hypothetical protein
MCQMCMRGRRDFRDASATNTGDGAAEGTPALQATTAASAWRRACFGYPLGSASAI